MLQVGKEDKFSEYVQCPSSLFHHLSHTFIPTHHWIRLDGWKADIPYFMRNLWNFKENVGYMLFSFSKPTHEVTLRYSIWKNMIMLSLHTHLLLFLKSALWYPVILNCLCSSKTVTHGINIHKLLSLHYYSLLRTSSMDSHGQLLFTL